MAIKPISNETFYREVDEELRKDKLGDTWKRYGVAIVGGALLLLAIVGGVIWWQNRERALAGARGEALVQVFADVQAGKTKAATPRLDELITEGSPGYRAAALLTKADLAIQSGNDAAAVAAFRQVATGADFAEPFRNLALLRQTTLEFDSLPPGQVIQRMQPLARAGGPWFGSAGELIGLAHLKLGQPAEAARMFAAMAKDRTVPPSLRSRAVQMAGSLGVDATQDAAAAGAAQPREFNR